MKIIRTDNFQLSLKRLLRIIAEDKKSAAINFNKELQKKIKDLSDFPFMYHKSYFFEDEYIRDLTHKGYSIPYEVDLEEKTISIIDISKNKNNLH
jgi:plasmid stabilization system protein ParE